MANLFHQPCGQQWQPACILTTASAWLALQYTQLAWLTAMCDWLACSWPGNTVYMYVCGCVCNSSCGMWPSFNTAEAASFSQPGSSLHYIGWLAFAVALPSNDLALQRSCAHSWLYCSSHSWPLQPSHGLAGLCGQPMRVVVIMVI